MSASLIHVMTAAAIKASHGLIRDFGEVENLQVARKGLGNFVSTADHRSEKILIEELRRARPDYNFLTEETGSIKRSNSPYTWIIDPLDGTSNFIHGLPHFCIALAVVKNETPIAAVTYDPIKDECFWAEKGKGAFLNRRRLRVSGRNVLEETIVGVLDITRTGTSLEGDKISSIEKVFPRTTSIRCMGSCALDLAYVAAGRFDVFVERGCSPWDIAGGMLLVQESGGHVKTVTKSSPLHAHAMIASNALLLKEVCQNVHL
jgi:myo-inositol-1(or 4)-monophosphatase